MLIQYNYTHDNYNGIAMFPGNSTSSVFRYNLSINDCHSTDYVILMPYACVSADIKSFEAAEGLGTVPSADVDFFGNPIQ